MGGIPLSEPKKQNYLHGAAILAAGVVIMKILGAIYKIPLRNILGDAGYGYFNAAYSIYNVLLTISTAGLPVALSRMISASSTLGRYNQVRRTFRVAYITLAVLGALLSALMLLFPSEMAIILVHTPESTQSVFALAPAVLLVCITSAYRGYIQGHADMRPTTVGQVLMNFPQLYMPLMELGLCCVTDETVMWTMERLARDTGDDADSVVDTLNARLQELF